MTLTPIQQQAVEAVRAMDAAREATKAAEPMDPERTHKWLRLQQAKDDAANASIAAIRRAGRQRGEGNVKANELINAWGRQKYAAEIAKHRLEGDVQIALEVEGRNDGFCPTCDAPYSAVVVYGTGQVEIRKGYRHMTEARKELAELRDVELSALLLEILQGATP